MGPRRLSQLWSHPTGWVTPGLGQSERQWVWGSPQAAPLSSILAPLPHTLQCRSWRSGTQSIRGALPADLAKQPGGTQPALGGSPEALLHSPGTSDLRAHPFRRRGN